jgi:exonuclease VII large subunit
MSGEVARLGVGYCERARSRMTLLAEQLSTEVSRYIERKQMFLAMAEGLVESRAPEKILQLGFAIVRCDGHAVTTPEGLSGREVEIQLAEGKLKAEVKNI